MTVSSFRFGGDQSLGPSGRVSKAVESHELDERPTCSSDRSLAARQAARRAARASASSEPSPRAARRRCDFADGPTPPCTL